MWKKILLVLVVLVAGFAGVVAMQPAEFHIERSATISGQPSAVFAQVNDFHKWEEWSPWAKLDPDSKMTYEGPSTGTGSVVKWAGNNEVGEGSMTITESRPNEHVGIRLDFEKPFASTAKSEFAFKPDGNQTVVTWSMSGHKNFISKAFCMFMSMDKMVGDKYEEGLASMKSVVEGTKK